VNCKNSVKRAAVDHPHPKIQGRRLEAQQQWYQYKLLERIVPDVLAAAVNSSHAR